MLLTDLAARWAMGDKAPKLREWLPAYAQDEERVPAWVKADMKTGVDLGLASQELFDALRDLDGR